MNYLFISESCNLSDCQNNATVETVNCTCVCKNNWTGEKCGKFDVELTIDVSFRTCFFFFNTLKLVQYKYLEVHITIY